MRFVALGGASEVGGSCFFIEVRNRRLLLDCGIRVGAAATDRLPDLARVHELAGVDAVFVSHAHMDHIGALPLICQAFPAVRIYCTHATKMLMQILLLDALKVMAGKWEQEAEIPLYDEASVSRMLGRVFPLHPGERVAPFGDDFEVLFYPAGHILGASCVVLCTADGNLLYTGDFSVTPQKTVDGLMVPPVKPDLLITETTYGTRLHANRDTEEKRLCETIGEIVQKGGKVLVPAFALGRAQEVILILQEGQRRGLIQPFPIWVDGLVKNICSAYSAFPDDLARKLSQRVSKEGNPFFNERGKIKAVIPPQREEIVKGGPCAIITSSGMLTGGPSVYYAVALAGDERNAILITGYQDEESPGRVLINLLDGRDDKSLILEGRRIQVACRIDRYSLSAHADSGQIASLVSRLAPKDLILVHGDGEARRGLGEILSDSGRVYLPENSDTLDFIYRTRPRERTSPIGKVAAAVGQGRRFDNDAIREIYCWLLQNAPHQDLFTPQELALLWYGSEVAEDLLAEAKAALSQKNPYFEKDKRKMFMLRLRPPKEEKLDDEDEGPLEQNRTLAVVDNIFKGINDLYRKGLKPDSNELILFFNFPLTARERFAHLIALAQEKTRRTVILAAETQIGAIEGTVRDLMPVGCELLKNPSFFRDRNEVKIKVFNPSKIDLSPMTREFAERTGLSLQVEEGLPPAAPRQGAKDALGRWEQNAAFARIDAAFRSSGGILTRRSRKHDVATGAEFIELSFLSPQLGRRHLAALEEISREIGWELRINPEPNQAAISQRVRCNLPEGWELQKEPAIFKSEGRVGIKLAKVPAPDEWEDYRKSIIEATGYDLKLL